MQDNIFEIPIKYVAWNKQNQIPLYIAGSYVFRAAYISDLRCILLKPKEDLSTLPT